MGKQLGFYLTPDEEDEIIRVIRALNAQLVDDSGTRKSLLERVNAATGYIVIKGGDVKKLNKTSKYVDTVTSDIIEFRRTEYEKVRGVEPGRIWTELRYWDKEENLITKDKALDDLYKQIVKMIKKRTTKLKDSPYYISQSAQEYIQANDLTIN
jgi:hypothetical protein